MVIELFLLQVVGTLKPSIEYALLPFTPLTPFPNRGGGDLRPNITPLFPLAPPRSPSPFANTKDMSTASPFHDPFCRHSMAPSACPQQREQRGQREAKVAKGGKGEQREQRGMKGGGHLHVKLSLPDFFIFLVNRAKAVNLFPSKFAQKSNEFTQFFLFFKAVLTSSFSVEALEEIY